MASVCTRQCVRLQYGAMRKIGRSMEDPHAGHLPKLVLRPRPPIIPFRSILICATILLALTRIPSEKIYQISKKDEWHRDEWDSEQDLSPLYLVPSTSEII